MPAVLNQSHVLACLDDPAFYKKLPEFLTLQPKMTVGTSNDGCGGCSKTTRAANLVRDFSYTLTALRPERLAVLKAHLGVEELHITTIGKAGKWVVRVL